MPLSLDEFYSRLFDSGLVTRGELDEVIDQLPDQREPDAKQLAKLLVSKNILTAWQANQIYRGKGKSLVLGNYVLLDKIGQGGMGMVYKAEHQVMKRIVALKTLAPAITSSPSLVARFRREVEVAARLDHQNVVAAFDASQEGRTHYLVMQYVEGEDLSSLVKRDGPMPIEKAIDCIHQAAVGLQYAHQQGVIHRDIKPSNFLLDQNGTVKILDMGLARLAATDKQKSDLTTTGTMMGTVDFMAPEQAEDTKHADERSDIYSLGCTLYYLLTGRPVFVRDTVVKSILAHRDDEIPSLKSDVANVSDELEELFKAMLAKWPEDRVQTMSELVDRLQAMVTGNIDLPKQSIVTEDAKLDAFLQSIDDPLSAEPDDAKLAAANETRVITENEQHSKEGSFSINVNPQLRREVVAPKPTPVFSKLLKKQQILIGLFVVAGIIGFIVFWNNSGNEGSGEKNVVNKNDFNQAGPVESVNSVETSSESDQALTSVSPEAPASGLQFDGIDDYVSVPLFPPLDDSAPMTIEIWLTLGSYKKTNPVMLMGQQWMAIYLSGSAWGVCKLNGDESLLYYAPDSALSDERTHLAGIWDGTNLHLYINGQRASITRFENYPLYPTQGGLFIGGAPAEELSGDEEDRYFNGTIHQVRVSRGVRYADNFEPAAVLNSEPNTLSLLRFNAGEGTTVEDHSDHNRSGTIHGATW